MQLAPREFDKPRISTMVEVAQERKANGAPIQRPRAGMRSDGRRERRVAREAITDAAIAETFLWRWIRSRRSLVV